MKTLLLQFIFLILSFSIIYAADRGYGDPTIEYPDHPNWREREVHLWTNVCRSDPTGFRDKYVGNYNILLPHNYPAAPPLYWNLDLNRVARIHAIDMANNCGMQHESCGSNTEAGVRIRSYYTKNWGWGENIATSKPTGLRTVVQWVMDGNPPASDDPNTLGDDGHRTNIMSEDFEELGVGYAYGPVEWNHFWVQDFGNGENEYNDYSVTSGSHVFLDSNTITFMATFYDPSHAPQNAAVIVNDMEYVMTLHLGTDDRGAYMLELDRSAGCRQYYFQFTNSQRQLYRYPEGGSLVTYGEGGCNIEYAPPESLSIRNLNGQFYGRNIIRNIDVSNRNINLYLYDKNFGISKIIITDLQGRLFGNFHPTNAKTIKRTLRLNESLPRGIYLLHLISTDTKYFIFNIVTTH